MAQLRQDAEQFAQRGARVVILGPDGPNAFRRYWQEQAMPFTGLPDLGSKVAARYSQEVSLLKLGRMPALFVLDGDGRVVFAHRAASMSDIPANAVVLETLDRLAEKSRGMI